MDFVIETATPITSKECLFCQKFASELISVTNFFKIVRNITILKFVKTKDGQFVINIAFESESSQILYEFSGNIYMDARKQIAKQILNFNI